MSHPPQAPGRPGRRTPPPPETPPETPPADAPPPAPDGEPGTPELTAEQKAEAAKKAEAEAIDAIKSGFTIPDADADFKQATTPVRTRQPKQLAMDAVATAAYADWQKAEKPTTWSRMPVITYFLDPDDVPEWRRMIKKACEFVTPEGDASGVRARFGKDFVLTEKMAKKIGKPEAAGKTVLAWAAIDKRKVSSANGATDDDDDDDDN
jgi:hypothetical protein